ncbi:unnamed protein product [Allacma fusca]|uniref:Uncharacterized protein n=1 Tax=Allacma fusca TaxID=39272 RepID=A0A8J2LX88_9HEXA|nr:unnamed protein product [Allacma fusca]
MNLKRLTNDLLRFTVPELENLKAYKTEGRKIFYQISNFIKSNSRYIISKQFIAGSIGKNTFLGYNLEPGFEVVLFVRNHTYLATLTPVTEEFHSILQNLPSRSEYWSSFVLMPPLQNGFGVQFSFETTIIGQSTDPKAVTIEFELLPAYDFSSNVDEQTQTVLKKLGLSTNLVMDNNMYSGSLSEKTVEFVKNQSDFVHNVIRLAKLWDMKLLEDVRRLRDGDSDISERSSIIELIAIHAAQRSEGDILESFRTFLYLMMDIRRVNINFSNQNCDQFLGMKIIDGVNPYRNYVCQWAEPCLH